MKRILKYFASILLISGLTVFSLQLSSCDEETLDALNGDCTGCDVSAPWSKPGASSCYATQADCEAALGAGCVICN